MYSSHGGRVKLFIQRIVKLANILRSKLYIDALRREGVAAGTEHESMLRHLNCRHVVDIGANVGQFALVSRRCFPDARIDSFEPLAEPADCYERVFRHDGHAFMHRVAVGAEAGDAEIHVSGREDSSSLLPITSKQSDLFPGTEESHTETIRVRSLQDELDAADILDPALLKLDVQGYEMEALRGCEALLPRFSFVYCECSFVELYGGQALAHEVIDFLRVHDFELHGVYNMTFDNGRAIQADFLFARSDRPG